jgi:putative N6-adenine-specific DNA methylase
VSTLKLPPKSKKTASDSALPARRPVVSGARARVQAQVRAASGVKATPYTSSNDRGTYRSSEQGADSSRGGQYGTPRNANNGNGNGNNTNTDYRAGSNYGQRTSFTPRNSPKAPPASEGQAGEDKGFYGTGLSFRDAATRRVEQKQSKLARQGGDTPARNYTRDLEFAQARSETTYHTPHQNAYTPPQRAPKVVAQDDVHAAQPFFASCPRGLEWALVQELEVMGITVVNRVASGAMLSATWAQIAQANVRSRIASRFLWQLSAQNVRGEDDIYAQASRIPWEKFFNWRDTIKVDTVGIRAEVRSLEFVTLRVKDAVCDRFRSIDGNRPSVDTAQPNMRIMCVLDGMFSQLYLDTTGEPLFKRGWRDDSNGASKGEAPLKENLAAGLLALTEWRGDEPLYDPMCGSGTLMIEAAQQAYGIPSGAARVAGKHFAMQRFWHVRLPNEAYATPVFNSEHPPQLFASDINPEMVTIAAGNVQAAGLPGDAVNLGCMDVLEILPPTDQAGILVLNPPYGERMGFADGMEADAFYDAFAANLKRHFKGWTVWLLTSDEQVQARMRLKPNATHNVYNGAIACRWLKFEIT